MRFLNLFAALCAYAGVLSACTLVEGDRIVGKQLAEEHTSFADIDPSADLGPAPVSGGRRTFRYFEIERIANQHSVILDSDAPREACFERVTVRLNEAMLHDALDAEVELLDFSRTPLPAGSPEFRPEGLSSTGMWSGRWLYGENRSVPIWVRVKGMRPEIGKAGPEIARGDIVRVEIRSGGVLLAFDAAAENSGHIGEPILVRNPVDGQRLRAIAEARGKVGIRK